MEMHLVLLRKEEKISKPSEDKLQFIIQCTV